MADDAKMTLEESEARLKGQEKEKLYSGMKVDQLREVAIEENLDTKGDKTALVRRLVDKAMGKEKTQSQIFLEEAIMSWSSTDMRVFLLDLKKPQWGSKQVMTDRIIMNISIDEAVEINNEYRLYLASVTEKTDTGEDVSTVVEAEEKKRKRDEKDNKESEQTDEDEDDNMEIESEEGNKPGTVKNTYKPRRSKGREQERQESAQQKVIEAGNLTKELGKNVDEAGWSTVGDGESVATERVDNVKRTRIGLTLSIAPSKDPDKQLCAIAQKWFEKMRESDSKFTLLPWKKDDATKGNIKVAKKIPNLMSKMRVYLSRAQARSDGGKINTDVYIQHTVPIADLRGDAEWFLKENNGGMYDRDLQVESIERKGWFLYSTQALDKKLLAEKIEEEIGVEVALRYKYINTEKYEELSRDERKKWMALHIEVATVDSKRATRGLARLYDSKSVAFPLGIRMRLVSEFREVKGNTIMMGKHTRLRIRQASFLSMTVGHPQDDIMLLDYVPQGSKNPSLRSMIMSIKSRNKETPGNLFHAIGKDWKGRIIMNYLSIKSAEASMIADGIIPYLEHLYGETVFEFFDPEAIVEKEEWFWDEEKNCIVNPLSKELDILEQLDSDYDFSQVGETVGTKNNGGAISDGFVVPKTAAELAAARLNMVVAGDDVDSVSTLGNPLSPARIREHQVSSLLPAAVGMSSGASVLTTGTIDTRMSAMEQTMQSMAVEMEHKFEASMEKFFERMQKEKAKEKDEQPPGGALAGGDND